jgi:hypothetical protein
LVVAVVVLLHMKIVLQKEVLLVVEEEVVLDHLLVLVVVLENLQLQLDLQRMDLMVVLDQFRIVVNKVVLEVLEVILFLVLVIMKHKVVLVEEVEMKRPLELDMIMMELVR